MCFTLALAYALALASIVNYDRMLQIVVSLMIVIMTIVIVL
jgi:hypothetical protein